MRKKRVVEMKMNENELCDDLPDEEFEDDEDYNYNDEEEYMGEEEEESEPEENDVDMRDKKRIKNAFIFRFLTQKPGEVEVEVMRQTQADFNSSSRPQSRPQSRSMDTQNTVILTGASQDVSSAINRILEDVADISKEEEEEENDMVGNEELKEGVEKNSVDEKTAGPDLTSEQESGDGKTKEEEEQDEGVKVIKKRKRRLISDPDGLHVRKLPPV